MMVKTGRPPSADEVENEDLVVLELRVLWGTSVLHVSHRPIPCSFYVGEEASRGKVRCDYFVPSEILGAARAPIVAARGRGASLVLLPRSRGYVDTSGQGKVSFATLIASRRATPSLEMSGAHEVDLSMGTVALMQLEGSQLSFQLSAVHAGKRLAAGALTSSEPDSLLYTGLSFLLHVGLVGALAFFMPTMRGDDSEDVDRDRVLLMQKLLGASADREREERETGDTAATASSETGGSRGKRAQDEEGAMGSPSAKASRLRYGVRGPSDNPDPHLARRMALEEAAGWATIGILARLAGADPNAPTAPWGRDEALGQDDKSAAGNIFGDSIGDAFGTGGRGLSGVGEGGGGSGEGIGIGDLGPLGRGAGVGFNQGIGVGRGLTPGGHTPKAPRPVRDGSVLANGRLPAEIIQRIVRQNFGRFRLCYENGLRGNPSLQGRVTVKFVIDRGGSVATVADGGSDVPDQSVVECVVRAFTNLSFPQPDGGMVTVVYPIMFSPGE
jgi:hypothetical protein